MKKQPYTPDFLPLNRKQVPLERLTIKAINASQKITELKILKKNIPIADFYPILQTKLEALSSTKIEGTQATLEEVIDDERLRKDSKNPDFKEISNYIKAFSSVKNNLDINGFTSRMIKEIHEILLSGNVRGKGKRAGEFRNIQVRVGNEYFPPEFIKIENYMGNLEKYINEHFSSDISKQNIEFNKNLPNVIKCAIVHAQFETIHPFMDGNGRVGRILIPTYLYFKGEIESPISFFISNTLEQEKYRYYDYLNGTRTNKESGWENWILFFLDAVIKHCDTQINLHNELDNLYYKCLEKIKKTSNSVKLIGTFNLAFQRIIITSGIIVKKLNIAPSTANVHLQKLHKLKILTPDDKSRNRKHYFYDVLTAIARHQN